MFFPFLVFVTMFVSPSLQKSKECEAATGHSKCSYLPDDQHCGAPHRFRATSRIIGGQEASLNEFPWMACLQRNTEANDHSCFCTGALISSYHVLTATHCVLDSRLGSFYVTLGEHNLSTAPDCDGDNNCAATVQRIRVRRITINNRSSIPKYLNDISILLLHEPATINRYVMPICLPFRGFDNTDNVPMKAAGWGKMDFSMSKERNIALQYYDVDPVPMEECKRLLSGGDFAVEHDRKVCTNPRDKTTNKIKTVGVGDSGGPLMTYKQVGGKPVYYVIGLASYTSGNSSYMTPTVYTRVSSYIPFILDFL